MYKVQDYVFFALYCENLTLILETVIAFLIYGKMLFPSLRMRHMKAVSSNSINSPQNLLLAQILLWRR